MAEQQQTKKAVLIIVLGAVLAAVLVIRSGLLPFGSGKGGSTATSQGGKVGKSATPGAKNGQPLPLSAQVQWKKPDPIGPVNDPMRMELPPEPTQKTTEASQKPPEEPGYRVAGIVFSTEQPSSVIIDGRILHEGDTIHDATVVKIAESFAVLRRGDKTWIIKAGQTNKEPE